MKVGQICGVLGILVFFVGDIVFSSWSTIIAIILIGCGAYLIYRFKKKQRIEYLNLTDDEWREKREKGEIVNYHHL